MILSAVTFPCRKHLDSSLAASKTPHIRNKGLSDLCAFARDFLATFLYFPVLKRLPNTLAALKTPHTLNKGLSDLCAFARDLFSPFHIARLILPMLFCLFCTVAFAQETKPAPTSAPAPDTRAPCQKTPGMPSFNITLVDTTQTFNTSAIAEGKKTVFIIFGPDCSHCRDFFARFFQGIDTFKNINFYLVTPIRNPVSFTNFYNDFHIGSYKNIKAAGRDLNFFAMDFFGIRQFPALVIYDEHKQYVKGMGPEAAYLELQD